MGNKQSVFTEEQLDEYQVSPPKRLCNIKIYKVITSLMVLLNVQIYYAIIEKESSFKQFCLGYKIDVTLGKTLL